MGDLAERDQDADPGQRRQRSLEIGAAGRDLLGDRLVAGREAFDGVEDDRAIELETIVRVSPIFAPGEAELEQGRVEQLAGIIAGEWPPGPVGALLAGREADDCEPRIAVAERRDRRVPPGG